MRNAYWLLMSILSMGLYAPLLVADSLYRWTDAHGVQHLSDAPPPPPYANETQVFPAPRYAGSARDNHYSISKQLERMQTAREAVERDRRERRREAREMALREREVRAAERAAERGDGDRVSGAVIAAPYRRHPPPRHRPSHGPPNLWAPDHPAYRVPFHQPRPVSGRAGYGRALPER